jgi:hypothetical protein
MEIICAGNRCPSASSLRLRRAVWDTAVLQPTVRDGRRVTGDKVSCHQLGIVETYNNQLFPDQQKVDFH